MSTPQITIHDVLTGEVVIRDMNSSELAQLEANKVKAQKDVAALAKAEQVKADKRQIILDRLGITADEFNALLG
jgi:hypothetical protein